MTEFPQTNAMDADGWARGTYALALVACLLLICGCRKSADAPVAQGVHGAAGGDERRPLHEELRPQVAAFCGACHAMPEPAHYPREAWRKEVEQGYTLFYASSLTDVPVPPREKVVEYYESRAPLHIERPLATQGVDAGNFRFERVGLGTARVANIAHLNWLPIGPGGARQLVICDMGTGAVQSVSHLDTQPQITTLATLEHPSHVEACDLDGDGAAELIVADLGSFTPADHDRGRIVWLRPVAGAEEQMAFESIELVSKLPRVADVQPVDYDQDGDQDLLVAAFGWRQTGQVLLLEHQGAGADLRPQFQMHELDERHGAIHVPAHDWNNDQRPDIAVLFSQEHETVELFYNDGSWKPQSQRIYAADRASFGSSGIAVADVNGDRRMDILFTNGDMFDDYYVRDYHAVHWLENQGEQWRAHELARMPGVHRALAADFDGDGDLDIAACALIPADVLRANGNLPLDSLIVLEQTAPGEFTRRVLEIENCRHATLCVADFDGDGDDDIAVGNYSTDNQDDQPPVFVWWNRRDASRSDHEGGISE